MVVGAALVAAVARELDPRDPLLGFERLQVAVDRRDAEAGDLGLGHREDLRRAERPRGAL